MMKNIKNFLVYIPFFSGIIYNTAIAGGFTSGKNKYDFTAEYEPSFFNNSAGTRNGIFAQDIEIDNEFGITENQSIGIDLFYNTEYQYSDVANNISRDSGKWAESFQVRHRATIAKIGNFGFGIQNSLYVADRGESNNYSTRWALRLMARHDNPTGFYKHFRIEIENRRWFQATKADQVRIDLRTRFRIVDGIDFYVRYLSFMNFASAIYLRENPSETTNGYFFKGNGDVKISHSDLYFGPEFKLVNDQSVYVYGTFRVDGTGEARRNRRQGLVFGYTKGFDL